jgi:hypothetical protein
MPEVAPNSPNFDEALSLLDQVKQNFQALDDAHRTLSIIDFASQLAPNEPATLDDIVAVLRTQMDLLRQHRSICDKLLTDIHQVIRLLDGEA